MSPESLSLNVEFFFFLWMQLIFMCTAIYKIEAVVSESLLFPFPKLVLIYRTFIKISLNVLVAKVFYRSSRWNGLSTAIGRLWQSCVTSVQSCQQVFLFGAQYEMRPAKITLCTLW